MLDGYELKQCDPKYGCGLIKLLNNFPKRSDSKDGFRSVCFDCYKKFRKEYRIKNREKILLKKREYRIRNSKKIKKYNKIYNIKNKESFKIKGQKYRENHKEYFQRYNKIYNIKNKEKIAKNKKIYRKNNKRKINKNRQNRLKNDINFKIATALRIRLWQAIKKKKKFGSAVKDLGCTIRELKQYLKQFFYNHPVTNEKMTWKNYGDKWHIDHIKPLCSFNLSKRKQFLKANHYTNLRPLWKEENFKKAVEDRKLSINKFIK